MASHGRRGSLTSMDLTRAISDVHGELRRVGLGHLAGAVDVEETWNPLHHVGLGLYFPSGARDELGTIRIPALALRSHNGWIRLMRWLGRPSGSLISLRDILRHEYGHALLDLLDRYDALGRPWGDGDHVSAYAETNADEDFAETMMLWLKRGGQCPAGASPGIRRKWELVASAIRAGRRRRIEFDDD